MHHPLPLTPRLPHSNQTQRAFLGALSPREASRLTERLVKYVVFKAVFVGAVLVPSLFEVSLWLGW